LTAAPEDSVKALLRAFGIDGFFAAVYGLQDVYARSKLARGQQLMADLGIAPGELILIGDTDHDLEVAKALGIEAVLLTGGHQCQSVLERAHHRVVAR
jgi:phosphoglycolate phosphatase